MTGLYASIIGLAAVVVLLALLCLALLRSHAEILRHLDRLGVRLDDSQSGAPLSARGRDPGEEALSGISGVSPDGEPIVISPMTGPDPVLIAFLSTTCSSCTVFWEGLDRPAMDIGSTRYRLVLVTLGAGEESPARARSLAPSGVDVVMSSQAWSDFQVPGAPYFVSVDPGQGRVMGEGSATTLDSLTTFLSDAAGDRQWDSEQTSVDRAGPDREGKIDEELRRAGIHPGHPSLHPEPQQRGDE